jgi:hypothetical protein
VQRELSKAEVERLFIGAIDQALAPDDQAAFTAELAQNRELQVRFEAYRATVQRLQASVREKAPDALASTILRRTRRRRFALRSNDLLTHWRVPAELVIPLLLAALVALYMILGNP